MKATSPFLFIPPISKDLQSENKLHNVSSLKYQHLLLIKNEKFWISGSLERFYEKHLWSGATIFDLVMSRRWSSLKWNWKEKWTCLAFVKEWRLQMPKSHREPMPITCEDPYSPRAKTSWSSRPALKCGNGEPLENTLCLNRQVDFLWTHSLLSNVCSARNGVIYQTVCFPTPSMESRHWRNGMAKEVEEPKQGRQWKMRECSTSTITLCVWEPSSIEENSLDCWLYNKKCRF